MRTSLVLASTTLLLTSTAASEPTHRHHVALFAGGTYHSKKSENGGAVGLEYEYRFHENLGVGAVLEGNIGIKDDPIVLAVPFTLHPYRGLRLLAGPGFEFKRAEEFLFRFGIGWDFHVGEHLVLTPLFTGDLVDGNANYNYGLALGWAF